VHQRDLTERILRLRQVPTMAHLPTSDLAQLAASLRARTFKKGDVLLREDEPPRSFFMLGSGTVTMHRHGKRIGTVRGTAGVGFLSVLARTAGGTAAVANSYVDAFEVRADAMEEIFEDHFSVLIGTIRWIAQRLLAELVTQPPPPFTPPDISYDVLLGDRELGIVERIFLLRRMRAFTEANVNSLAAMARAMTEVRANAGDVIWRPGDRADASVFVVKGMLDLSWKDGAVVQQVGPGYALGGAESLVDRPRWNELVAREPVLLLRGQVEGLIDTFEDDLDLALRFMSMLGTYLMSIWDRKAETGIAAIGGPAAGEGKDSVPNLLVMPEATP
jgi:CRP-like cAMP-binding protein